MKRTIEEIIDVINQDLTVGGALPKQLPDTEIRRIIENEVMPWFYLNYQYAVQKIYYYVAKEAFQQEEFTQYNYITLPCEIKSIPWIYMTTPASAMNIGINVPNLSVNLGVNNQPYLTSYVTTVSELALLKANIDSLADMLNQFTKFTHKYHYNEMTNRLHILTRVEKPLILEAYASIENESLFGDPYFIKYATGACKVQLANLLGRLDFTLPGGVKYNVSGLETQGKEQMQQVIDEIKNMSNSAFFFMVKK